MTDALEFARPSRSGTPARSRRERYQRNLDELNEHLRDSSKILIDITAAERNKLDQQVISGQLSKEDALTYGVVKPDDEHVLWPFDGEYWRDELGFYRRVVTSKCSEVERFPHGWPRGPRSRGQAALSSRGSGEEGRRWR